MPTGWKRATSRGLSSGVGSLGGLGVGLEKVLTLSWKLGEVALHSGLLYQQATRYWGIDKKNCHRGARLRGFRAIRYFPTVVLSIASSR